MRASHSSIPEFVFIIFSQLYSKSKRNDEFESSSLDWKSRAQPYIPIPRGASGWDRTNINPITVLGLEIQADTEANYLRSLHEIPGPVKFTKRTSPTTKQTFRVSRSINRKTVVIPSFQLFSGSCTELSALVSLLMSPKVSPHPAAKQKTKKPIRSPVLISFSKIYELGHEKPIPLKNQE